MNFNFGNYTAKVNGATVIIDTAQAGDGDVKMTLNAVFDAEIVYLTEPPQKWKSAIDHWLRNMAAEAKANALVEGLTPEQAWDDYFTEKREREIAAAARRMARGKEFVPHGEPEPKPKGKKK